MTGSSLLLQGDARRIPLADQSVDLVFGSPPYVDARLYLEGGKNLGIARKCLAWVEWMIDVTLEAQRVCRGPVLWVAAGKTKDRNYQPAVEGLMWEWWKRGGNCHLYRPCYWHRVGISGSGGDQWFRSDIEYVACFKRPGKFPWADNTAMGHAPKWAPGGEMSHRLSDGTRRNQWGGGEKSSKNRRQDGLRQASGRPSHRLTRKMDAMAAEETSPKVMAARESMPAGSKLHTKRTEAGQRVQVYTPPAKANPGNLIKGITVGGGQMGNRLAHENEAPFPDRLAEFFIRSFCPLGGVVLDPFSGSATTVSMAVRLGRHGVGMDLRRSQCELGARRVAEDLLIAERPHAPRKKRSARKDSDRTPPLFGAFK